MASLEKIKDYYTAVTTGCEGREWMEKEVWSTEVGLQDLMDWFEEELALGLTEEEMDEAIAVCEDMANSLEVQE